MSTAPTRVRLGMPTVRPVHGEGEILLNTPFPESAREQLGNCLLYTSPSPRD